MRSVSSEQGDDVSIAILNAAFYITTVLREWADNVVSEASFKVENFVITIKNNCIVAVRALLFFYIASFFWS